MKYLRVGAVVFLCFSLMGCGPEILLGIGAISAVRAVREQMQAQKNPPADTLGDKKPPPDESRHSDGPHQNRKGCTRLSTGWHCE